MIKGYEITRVIRMSWFTFTPFMSLRFNFPRIRQVDAIHPSMINLSTMKRGENFQMASKLEQCLEKSFKFSLIFTNFYLYSTAENILRSILKQRFHWNLKHIISPCETTLTLCIYFRKIK